MTRRHLSTGPGTASVLEDRTREDYTEDQQPTYFTAETRIQTSTSFGTSIDSTVKKNNLVLLWDLHNSTHLYAQQLLRNFYGVPALNKGHPQHVNFRNKYRRHQLEEFLSEIRYVCVPLIQGSALKARSVRISKSKTNLYLWIIFYPVCQCGWAVSRRQKQGIG